MSRIKGLFYALCLVALLYFIYAYQTLEESGQIAIRRAKYKRNEIDTFRALENKSGTLFKYDSPINGEISEPRNFTIRLEVNNDTQLEYCKDILENVRLGRLAPYNRVPDLTTDAEVVELLESGCEAFRARYGFSETRGKANNATKEELEFPVAYSVVVHRQLHQFAMLFSATYRTQNLYCIHVDKKSDRNFQQGAKMITQCFGNVFLSSKSEHVIYASFSRLQADVNCMRDMLQVPKTMYNWKYLLNLCGQDFPGSTNFEIVQQLKALRGKNSIPGTRELNIIAKDRTSFVYRTRNVTQGNEIVEVDARTKEKHSPPPFNMTQVKNLAYNAFTRDFLQWALVDSPEGSTLLNWSSFTHTPDEHFWSMLNTYPGAPGGSNFVSWWSVSRAVMWKNNKAQDHCHGYWQRGVCVFGGEDLHWLMKANQMFLNKFDVTYDVTPVTCLRKFLDQREKGDISSWNPNKRAVTLPKQMLTT